MKINSNIYRCSTVYEYQNLLQISSLLALINTNFTLKTLRHHSSVNLKLNSLNLSDTNNVYYMASASILTTSTIIACTKKTKKKFNSKLQPFYNRKKKWAFNGYSFTTWPLQLKLFVSTIPGNIFLPQCFRRASFSWPLLKRNLNCRQQFYGFQLTLK